MKALFLDVDGVLNSAMSRKGLSQRALEKIHDEPEEARAARLLIDPAAVVRIDRVVERTGCSVVLSSMWRIGRGFNRTRRVLRFAGAKFKLIDKTPDCAQKVGELYIAQERGAEIAEWLAAHPEVTRIAIVDDECDMGPLCSRLVQTQFTFGIQDEHVEELVALLGERTA